MERDNELQTETVNFIDIKMLKWCSMSFVVNNLIDAFILFAFFNGWLLLKMCQEENVFLFRFKIVPRTYHQFVTSNYAFNGDKFELRTKRWHFSDAIATTITIASCAHTHKHTFVCIANGMAREKSISARTNLMKQTRSIETIDLNEFKMKPNNSAYIVHTIDYRPYSIQIHLCNILWMKKKINLHNDSSNWVTELNVIYDQFVGWPCMLIFIEISLCIWQPNKLKKCPKQCNICN